MTAVIFPPLTIPETLAAGPGPGNTDPRVLAAFANAGLADHMQADVLRGMIECKLMLREVWGTRNIHTFGVAGTGWSGLDCLFGAILPGDTVVAFVNGTFSGIDALTVRMKAAGRADLAADELRETLELDAIITFAGFKRAAAGGQRRQRAVRAHGFDPANGRLDRGKAFLGGARRNLWGGGDRRGRLRLRDRRRRRNRRRRAQREQFRRRHHPGETQREKRDDRENIFDSNAFVHRRGLYARTHAAAPVPGRLSRGRTTIQVESFTNIPQRQPNATRGFRCEMG